MKKILMISGARPNLVKLAPLYKFIQKKKKFKIKILHTNQHSDKFLYLNICKNLEIKKPDYLLNKYYAKNNVYMISYFIREISNILEKFLPDLVILFGDVDTTLAAAIASSKRNFKIFHVESGLRSNDFKMQEEINRRVTDHLADINFCPTQKSLENLKKEGLGEKSYLVGNIIFDNFLNLKKKIQKSSILKKLLVRKDNYILLTSHRYQIINYKINLRKLCKLINNLSENIPLIFSCHSRTKKNLKKFNLLKTLNKNVKLINPLTYTDFAKLLINSKLIVTDSGGVHEEAFFHNKKCMVLRDVIEREDLIDSQNIFKINFKNYKQFFTKIFKNKIIKKKEIENWDGKVSQRIYKILIKNAK